MPAPESSGVLGPPSKRSGDASPSGIIEVFLNGKAFGKRQRKSTELAAVRSDGGMISETGEAKKRKCVAKHASEAEASPGYTSCTVENLPSRSGLRGRRRSNKSLLNSNVKPSSFAEIPEVREGPLDHSSRETSKLDNENGRQSTEKVRAVKESSIPKSVTPKAVPVSTRINAPKVTHLASPPEENAAHVEMANGRQRKQRRKRRKTAAEANVDEKTRIKRRVKNLVNRIRLEQNLLDAYAGEGWKGHSREKIRPERELQRAHMQILRCKLAVRDLIRDLDNLSLEGSLEESAFDEEGRIFHEEIFCARCKSQEASIDNDIILCDGACDRGFHQECLDPPLATTDIPPGDEGWLCPVCDYKVECLNYINGYLGTEFQVEDRWENIFAEAAGSAGGSSNAVGGDWPSEDSEDDDYDPQKIAIGDEKEGEGGGDAGQKRDSLVGSGSEPEASSGSDLSNDDCRGSDVSGDELEDDDRRPHRGHSESERVLNLECTDHALAIPTATLATEDVVPVLGKRRRAPVDYKKLHAEMFGKEDVDDEVHSEDEEWGPRRGRRGKSEGVSASASWTEQDLFQRKSLGGQQAVDGSEPNHIPRRSYSAQETDERKARRLPDAAVEALRKEFELGICFPTRAYKESLVGKLGISFQQISSWFKNARHVAKQGTVQSTLTTSTVKNEVNTAFTGNLSGREGGVEGIEVTNGLLIEKLDEVQVRLQYLKQALEAIVAKPDAGFESNRLGNSGDGGLFDSGIVMSHANGKRILYVPVAEVVEKAAQKGPGNPLV